MSSDNPLENISEVESEEIIFEDFTTFDEVETRFLGSVTDDMYVALNKEDTEEILDEILIEALPWFKNPREINLLDYDRKKRCFKYKLDELEIQIVNKYMMMIWVQRQLFTIDLIKQKYSSGDFKLSSQAAHIKQLVELKKECEREGYHLQSDYSRRKKNEKGIYKSTFGQLMEKL